MAYNISHLTVALVFLFPSFLLISQGSLTDFYDSKIMLHSHIIYFFPEFLWEKILNYYNIGYYDGCSTLHLVLLCC